MDPTISDTPAPAPIPARIGIATLAPGDVIVLECEEELGEHRAKQLNNVLHLLWPDHRVLFLDRGLHMSIVRPPKEG